MDRLAYVAMTGARQTELGQAVVANNLANASTIGFRADLADFAFQPVEGTGFETRVNVIANPGGVDLAPGVTQTTGRALDVAINGEGYLAVQAADGSEAYTRAGNLSVGSGGLLLTASGLPVLGDGGPVAIPPNETLLIGSDGTVTVRPLGQGPEALAVVDRIKLVRPDPASLLKGTDGLLRQGDGGVALADAAVTLESGVLESSNVNIADTLVTMITLARQFEAQINTIRNAEDNADASATLLRASGA